ncbi:Outer membrane protein beta-barrel domain-containing protein [Algoriphagus boritolerans DSM 17298 = JCM 18970]|uniref:Outer membrane protein beta-barrel domain-containing protein n=2 Tax=Algoriphagus TaxID=246875 RepID=A0A1H5USC9_9BACT|nr:Outer membrane protein beta-barrel domain-containing protein [Algoriphagus boritolerans DSM 17298 = JCM 18970]
MFFGMSFSGSAQGLFGLTSTSGSDDRLLSYGFFLAGHTATYQIKYSEAFFDPTNTANNQIYSIYPKYTPGFSLGFTGILRFHDQVNLLFTPKIAFYEYRTDINYYASVVDNVPGNDNSTGNNLGYRTEELVNEATMVELPLLFKYRSQRFNNTRMYFIGGGSYQFRTKSQDEANLDPIVTRGQDFTIEMGMGFEIYFKYFKFAPEIRFSHGLNNIYYAEKTPAEIRDAISSIKRKGITIYLNFQ